ncbi:MAG: hypothetical protein SWY16_00775 [Cyanobacteriota bacterium]|nr:hypothetical protein [Cyanobacteriota bacterium]
MALTAYQNVARGAIATVLLTIATLTIALSPAGAQSVSLLEQTSDRAQVQPLSPDKLNELGDPFFNLVLQPHPDVTNLAEIETLLQPDASGRETYVVDERIVDKSAGQTRRSVLAFRGTNGEEFLEPNVMMAVGFNSNEFSDTPDALEVWGWDDERGRYNYYKLDAAGTNTLSWKFRGSSVGASALTPRARQGTCMACHVNGAPIMKELFFPWNNWHSFQSEATYLRAEQRDRWPVAQSLRLQTLTSAEELEKLLISAIGQFNSRKIDTFIETDRSVVRVPDAKELLKPLFATTEVNFISSDRTSNLHPFSSTTSQSEIAIPDSFFLNAELIAGGGAAKYRGLGITESRQFSQVATLQPQEYDRLVRESAVKLAGIRPGDAHFAWFVPEASHIDNDAVDRLMAKGIVPREFVAAAIAIDLENPILSPDRQRLLAFVPDEFQVKPTNTLIPETIAALERANPSSNSPEGRFLSRLKSDDPIALLQDEVNDYLARETQLLGSDEATRFVELKRLYSLAISRRQNVLGDEVLRNLDETQGFFLPLS